MIGSKTFLHSGHSGGNLAVAEIQPKRADLQNPCLQGKNRAYDSPSLFLPALSLVYVIAHRDPLPYFFFQVCIFYSLWYFKTHISVCPPQKCG